MLNIWLANVISYSLLASAFIVTPTLLLCTAPYGRYCRGGWGFMLPSRFAWMTQELPSFIIPAFVITHNAAWQKQVGITQWVALTLFTYHYFWRAIVFPLLMTPSKKTPLSVWLLAITFCVANGYQQSVACTHTSHPEFSVVSALAVCFWAVGLTINIDSDLRLLRLRKQGPGYKIPRGGCFEFVSAANYFGEILEWTSWAILCRNWSALSFAVFTLANLGPRAWHHHQWYKKQFPTYPIERKAIIPFIL